jgi:DNA-binding NarL/FixJ family response regulator
MAPIRVLLADDHTVVRQGLVSLLEAGGECEVVAQAADGLQAVAEARRTRPQVAVLDLGMPGLNGLEAVRRIHAELPAVRILVLTVHDEQEYVLPVVRAGAAGYLVKDSAAAELLAAVRALASGQGYFGPQAVRALAEQLRTPDAGADPYGPLTAREREVFHLVVQGRTTKEVAHSLGISVKTAENHRTRILEKLGLHNAAELVLYASRKGLLG